MLVLGTELNAQKKDQQFTVVFYNVENLYDTEDDPETGDEEFTPGGPKRWTLERYQKKIEDLAQVLSSVSETELPEIIGVCEVENRKVLEDLAGSRKLRRGDYRIVHSDGPDARGIEAALLYREDLFKVRHHQTIEVVFPFNNIWCCFCERRRSI